MQSTVCDSVEEPATKKVSCSPIPSASVELLRSTSQSPVATASADAIPPSLDIEPSLKQAMPTKSTAMSSTDFSISSILSRQAPAKPRGSPIAAPPQSLTRCGASPPPSRDSNVDVVSISGRRKDDDDVNRFNVVRPAQRRDSDYGVGDGGLSAALRQLLSGPSATAAMAAAAASGSPWYPTWLQSALLHRRIGLQTSSTDGLYFRS